MKNVLWPTLLAIGTASLCLGLLEPILDVRGASPFVRPYHHACTLVVAPLVVGVFWPLYRCIGWLRRRGAFLLSVFFLVLLLCVWAFMLPLGDRLAVRRQRLDPQLSSLAIEPPGYGWFYMNDSGMGDQPMHVIDLIWTSRRPSLPVVLLVFVPCFFYLHRNSNETGSA